MSNKTIDLTDQPLISAFATKTPLSQLVKKVEQGKSFTIIKHIHPIAILLPATLQKNSQSLQEAINRIKA